MADEWMDVPAAPVPGDGWQNVPPPEPVQSTGALTGTQGISDRLSRGFHVVGNPLASYATTRARQLVTDTADFFHEGVKQTVGALNDGALSGAVGPFAAGAIRDYAGPEAPSQFEDPRPEVEKQLISIGRTPEAAKRETEALMRSWKRQERMGGLVMGPLTALTAPLFGAYRSLISRPLEEAGGPPKEVTEMVGLVAGIVAGMPAMSRQMARVTVKPDGKVTAQAVGDLPVEADFKTAADLVTQDKPGTNPTVTEQNLRTLWDERGIHPAEALNDAKSDAFLKHELTQPEPPAPEKIQTAAVRIGDKVFTGFAHADAIVRAEEVMGVEPGALLREGATPPESGFLTTTGRFVDRHEADRIARGPAADAGGLDSWNLPELHDQPGLVRTPHPDRPLGEALRAADELRAANRGLPNEDRAILGELISAVRSAAAKRQLSVEDGVVQQGDRFGKKPLAEAARADEPAIVETAWLEADQDLARAQAAMARIEEVKARHPELAPAIDRAVQAVEDTLAQRDAMRPEKQRAPDSSVRKTGDNQFEMTIKSDDGENVGRIEFTVTTDAVTVRYPFIESDFQGMGFGVKAYQTLIDWALDHGKEFRSDRNVSPSAVRVYDALERRGYKVIRPPKEDLAPSGNNDALQKAYDEIKQKQHRIGTVYIGDLIERSGLPKQEVHDVIRQAALDGDATLARTSTTEAALSPSQRDGALNIDGDVYHTVTLRRSIGVSTATKSHSGEPFRVVAGPQPRSLGAAATDPPLVPLTEQPPPPAGALVASAQEGIRTLFDIGRDIQMKVAPMTTGTRDSILAAKDFANTMRKNRWEWARIHDHLTKNFTPEQLKRMWDAADEESVLRQEGKTSEHMGIATLTPEERAIVEGLHARAQNAWLRARDIGLVEGEGLPAYTPRMVINAAGAIAEQGSLPLNSMGTNLKASTARLLKRKYLTAEETEAAAKAKTGMASALKLKSMAEIEADVAKVELVRDIRTLPLAIAQLEDAIAGRTLVNEIKKAGKAGGSETVVEGAVPAGSDAKWFTIDHPALKTWRPKFKEVDGKLMVLKDADGNTIFEQVPIYIRGDFEGPLRAVLEGKSGATYQFVMDLKGKTMSVIMYSPAIHNLVEFGRAFPAMPTRIFKAYFDGNRAKNDVAIMTEAIDSGLVPIGKRFFMQDLNAIMESPDLTPGRSWTAKLASAVLTSERLLPQTDWMRAASEKDALAIKRGIDKMGDFWHNTLLWDRIGDLQMGLYVNLRGDLIAKGVDSKTASITAAHWANRYAGALPQEAMSAAARKTANMFLFSRSFTMGNLGVMKDMLTGLPKDVLAMIEREGGFKEGSLSSEIPQIGEFSKGMAMRKAMAVVMLDIALMYVGNSVLQSTFNVMLGDKTLDEEAHGYTRRMRDVLNKVEMHPTELLHPFELAERISATGDNEPGRRDRIRIGYQKDGTAIYARNPVGKIGEEFIGFMNNPLEMLRKKEGTIARPALQIFANDKGFDRKVYDPNAETYTDKAAAIWAMVEHFAKAQTPEGQINALSDLIKGEGDPKTTTLQTLGPFAGVTFSKGAPGGPAIGELYDFRSRHDIKVNMALPDIRKQILRGDLGGAMQRMRELDIPPALQRFYIRTTLDPSTRASGRTLRDFYMNATPEQRDRLERARQ